MNKVLTITGAFFSTLLVTLLAAGVAVQSPKVQTWIGKKAVAKIEKQLGGHFTFDEVRLNPFDALVLKNVVILDDSPYTGRPQQAVVDTFARADRIAATFSLKSLFQKQGLHFNRAEVDGFVMNLAIEPGDGEKTTTNLQRIFRLSDDNEVPEDRGDVFDIDRFTVKDFTFRMFNFPMDERFEREKRQVPSDAIDWNNLEIKGLIRGRKMKFSHLIMSGTADEVTIREKSGFAATLSGETRVGCGMSRIRNLRIDDGRSALYMPEFKMTYRDQEAFNDFLHGVRLQADIARSVLDMQTIAYFAPALKDNTFRAELTGKVDGRVDDLAVKDIAFRDLRSNVSGRISGRVTGLPDAYGMITDFKVADLRFTTDGLGRFVGEWAPKAKLDLGKFAKGETLSFTGTGHGPLNRLAVKGTLGSARLGSVQADLDIRNLIDPKRALLLGGNIKTKDLQAGRIIGNDALGAITLDAGLEARLAAGGPEVRIDSVRIDRLGALGYDYSNILATGTYSHEAFDGRIVCDDPNLNFIFQGLFNLSSTTENAAYQFYANLGYADLHALNIDKRGKSKVSFRTNANFMYIRHKDLIGDVSVADIILEDANGRHNIGNASIQAHSNDNVNRIQFSSKFADGTYIGSKPILAMVEDIQELTVRKELPALGKAANPKRSPVPYRLDFNFHNTRDLLSFIAPGVYIADSTRLSLAIAEDGLLEGQVRSRRLAMEDKYLKDVLLKFDNRGEGLDGRFTCSEIKVGGISMKNNSGSVHAQDNHIGVGYTFRNDADNNGEVFAGGDLYRTPGGALALRAQAHPSAIRYNGQTWNLQSNDILLCNKDIDIKQFRAACNDQTLLVDGCLSPNRKDTLDINIEKLDISLLNHLTGLGLDLQGKATGKARLISPTKPQMGLLANLACDSTYIASQPVGLLRAASRWNDEKKAFDMVLRNELDGKHNLNVRGTLKPSDRTINVLASMDGLNAAYAAPLLKTVFSEVDGRIDGKVRVEGPLNRPEITSEGLAVRDGLLRIDFTNVAYRVNGPVDFHSKGIIFKDMALSDGESGEGTLSGGIRHDHFKDMTLDIRADIRDMHALDLTARQNPTFYGNVYGTGRVLVKGPFDDILIDVDARTARTGEFHLPLGAAAGSKSMDLLTFTEPVREVYVDPYEAMMSRGEVKRGKASDLGVKLRIAATPGVTAFIEIDKDSGHMLTGQGSGTIEIETRTSSGLFTINGDYTLTSGNYKLSVMNIVNRDFAIRDGSSIRFGGDIMDSDLDINALYTVKTSLSNLISEMDVRRNVECGIHIFDKLRNPRIDVSIDVPNLDPAAQGYIDSALSTDDKKQKQFLYLLITGSFLPAEESGIVNNSSMLYSNVSNIMATQLNSIFEKLDIPLDLGLNYQTTDRETDLFDLALSTQLFNNRVIVNGTIGNREYSTSGTGQEVVGDLDVDIKLNRPGTLRLNLFSHSADQYTAFLDNSQRHGGGISWQREFNTFKEFLQDPFNRKRRTSEEEEKIILQIDSLGNAVPLLNE